MKKSKTLSPEQIISISKKQQVKCVVHNRAFSPLMTIDLEKLKSNYETNLFMIKVYDNVINIKFKDDVKNFEKLDWTK